MDGDKFHPLGANGTKKIGKFLTNKKILKALRDKSFVLEDKNKIVWLCPVRLSEKVKVTSKTERIIQISIKENSHENSQL